MHIMLHMPASVHLWVWSTAEHSIYTLASQCPLWGVHPPPPPPLFFLPFFSFVFFFFCFFFPPPPCMNNYTHTCQQCSSLGGPLHENLCYKLPVFLYGWALHEHMTTHASQGHLWVVNGMKIMHILYTSQGVHLWGVHGYEQ